MFKSGQLHLPRAFARENRIKKAGEITLVDKHGVKWSSCLKGVEKGQFYMSKGWRGFCAANGIKTAKSFTLEFVRGQGTNLPMLKLCPKIDKAPFDGHDEERETRMQKRANFFTKGEPSRQTRASSKCSAGQGTVKRKQPLQPCSITDQVAKVKQIIVDALTSVEQISCELEIKKHTLEALLHEIDVLGFKVTTED